MSTKHHEEDLGKELQQKLVEAEEKAAENWDKFLRAQAEMGNMVRRTERDVSNAHKYALEKFVTELLPVIDNLERAILVAEEGKMPENVLEGLHMTIKSFLSTLLKFGVEQIDPQNEAFNPEFHQAISTEESNKVEPGTVLKVLQKGYLLNQRLIRPALVIVSKS